MGHLDLGRYTITFTGPLAWVVLVLVTAFLMLP